ncbi:hypothetical protein A6P39_018685 [Streptomyces sp. FXJ1.172]|uniref:hypothetical protein n=1 Tax=Streptomyces sp. FXJ1.172 TaxID=710705 RepID=UPI0007D01B7E|nr:hypothetical protein [Streptomyces sp. FXJ1.172]WEO95903.1 hypothetical protein A6P39_018685 [Streptomyces sp. FXJ1.172]
MSTPEAQAPPRADGAPADEPAAADEPRPSDGAADPDESEERDQPQNAWSARRDLVDHSPRTMNVGARARFSGGLLGGDQHGGISGGHFTGDVILGGKTEVYQLAVPGTAAPATGEVPEATLEELERGFAADEQLMSRLLRRLRDDRVLVLSGGRFTGRRTAALMLLRRLGALPVRTLAGDTAVDSLADRLGGEQGAQVMHSTHGAQDTHGGQGTQGRGRARGHVLCDLAPRRDQPLRWTHLLAARARLAEQDAYLVVTLDPGAALDDVTAEEWHPPGAADVLAVQLRARTDEETAGKLLGLPQVAEFLGRSHQPREVAEFARLLARHAAGEVAEDAVGQFSLVSLENQVQEWFEAQESELHLRDKAFLVALAAFDGGPYALTAELSDLLYRFLQETENRARVPEVPVFGTHVGKRLQLARAEMYWEPEHTEWGPVDQQKAAFRDERASLVLLREVWTGHPSARPALIAWLRRLADDGRPLVRTRAASTVAVLARTDLPSAMALVIEPWGASKRYRQRLVAVNALALSHMVGTPNIPRILDTWCDGDDPRLRWVAVRAYALIGAERPEQALAALRGAVRGHHEETLTADGELERELAEAVELLLLSAASDQVLAELRAHLDDDRAVRVMTLEGFVRACRHTEGDERYGHPLVLGWFARAAADGGPAAQGVPFLWRAALADPRTTQQALQVLREWVLIADRSTAVEWALAALLPTLATTTTEHQRLSHLLRTMPGEDGTPPPRVAAQLLTVLSDF